MVNDGEVTALAGSMSLRSNAVLGISLGTSTAAGYVTPDGNITPWLNELAFVPVDYREGAPADEWSGDPGVGAQYFSQQAVSRLLPAAGIALPAEMPLAERLVEVQALMAKGDLRARRIYEAIGVTSATASRTSPTSTRSRTCWCWAASPRARVATASWRPPRAC